MKGVDRPLQKCVRMLTIKLGQSDAFASGAGSTLVRVMTCLLGAVSIRKTVLPGMAIPMLKIRRPNGRLIFNMEIAVRR